MCECSCPMSVTRGTRMEGTPGAHPMALRAPCPPSQVSRHSSQLAAAVALVPRSSGGGGWGELRSDCLCFLQPECRALRQGAGSRVRAGDCREGAPPRGGMAQGPGPERPSLPVTVTAAPRSTEPDARRWPGGQSCLVRARAGPADLRAQLSSRGLSSRLLPGVLRGAAAASSRKDSVCH